ncbi:MAG: hypothetical protein FJ027_06650 [Candidatus Rokubacteria bacterium]|nr:hypothetical protein [Candidatus Rokubacteria bacterium]
MKYRAQPFDCTIAGKLVAITLRHGGGLGEPAGVYVHCAERDCQYADLNQPPCPLRVEMFADGSDRTVAAYLVAHAGARTCYGCLVDALRVTHDQVRRASWRLRDIAGFAIKPSRCAVCTRRRVSIHVSLDAARTLAQRLGAPAADRPHVDGPVEAYLQAHPGYPFCVHCLARELRSVPAAVRELVWTLEGQPRYHLRTGQCVSCLSEKRVVRYEDVKAEPDAPHRVIALLAKDPGSAYCASCVAFATDVALPDARRMLARLEAVPEILHRVAECAGCGRWQMVTALRPVDMVATPHVAALLEEALLGPRVAP